MELDALEAVRRLTLERDALANELDAVKDDFRVSLQTLDSIRAATGLCNYGPHLAESLKAMKEDRDALAEQVKRLEADALQAPERRERHDTGEEAGEGANGAPEPTTGEKTPTEPQKWDGLFFSGVAIQLKEQYNGTQTREGCNHGRHPLCDKMVCTRHAPKHGERMGERWFWPLVSREDACGDWEGK